jgi:transposase InsO family protein
MTHAAIQELADCVRPRYREASRAKKKLILDEFCENTGYHRKAVIRLLNHRPVGNTGKRRGRPRMYAGGELMSALLLLWEASGFVCANYLPAALPALIERLEQSGGLSFGKAVRERLARISPSTCARLLKDHNQHRLKQPYIRHGVVSDLSHRIALHTFAELRDLPVGHMEIDLVLHCGMTTGGFFLTTLVAVDTRSSWTFCTPVWGKNKERVGGAVARLQREVPFQLLGIHSDNGTEFINNTLYQYCQRRGLQFTHSRPYHKNDQPRVEQRNGSLVRRLVGYGRYTSRQAMLQLEEVYTLACLHANFFRPTAKLLKRERQGARVIKIYDTPQTPFQRLLASGELTAQQEAALRDQYVTLNPLNLQRQLRQALDALWLLEAPDPLSERMQRLSETIQEAKTAGNPISETTSTLR